MIKLYLNMKNAKAEGIYNNNTGMIIVQPGANFERIISDSFEKHNYLKLRMQILNSDKVQDYKSIAEIEFSSLSAAAAVIGGRSAAGPKEWKLEDGRTLKEYLELDEKVNYFIEYFHKNMNKQINPKSLKQAEFIRKAFPLESIKDMSLEQYDKKGSKNTLCYLLEYQSKEISGGWFGSSQNKLFYDYNNQYLNSSFIDNKYPKLSIDEKFNMYKEDLYNLLAYFDKDNYINSEFKVLPYGANYIKSKLINIYHPSTILSLDSKSILMRIMDYFGEKTSTYTDSVEINIALLSKTHKMIPESKKMDPWILSSIYWDFFVDVIDKTQDNIEGDVEIEVESNQSEDLFIDDSTINEIVGLIKKKKNIILQGSPGTGKTFSIKKIINKNFNIYDSQEQILMVQFHQSFSYEEFIEGLRPTVNNAGFTVEPGF